MRVAQLLFSVGKPAVRSKLAVSLLLQQSAHDRLIVTVGHTVEILLLFLYLIHVAVWQTVVNPSELVLAVSEVAARAPLAA